MTSGQATARLQDNMGALTERVGGTEKQIGALSERMETLQRDTLAQFSNLANTVSAQFGAINDKIDRQAANFADARAPNMTALITATVAVLGLGATLFFAFMSPTTDQVKQVAELLNKVRETTVNRSEFEKTSTEAHEWSVSLRDRLRADEDSSVSQRQIKELAERMDERDAVRSGGFQAADARLQAQIDELRKATVTREEMQTDAHRTDERLTAIVNSLSDVRRNYTEIVAQALGLKPAAQH